MLFWAYTQAKHLGARLMDQARGRARRHRLVAILFLDAAELGVFKYYDFFVGSAARLLGLKVYPHNTLGLLLPVGISFYSLMSIGYCVDVYRGQLKPETNLLYIALFLGYFLLTTAGPIERADRLTP